ncbi:MAG: protein TolQ [Gammaproteobacteria bacterium RIFCSPHIGHO2_12_FULL_45_9]|nr:MAG: protein TolQ [Gammaproteobacteria bacterium RIFCSPHIGHO2_12_FULL_45_9]
MTAEPSLWSFIANASLVVKGVILLLSAASIASWTLIFQRNRLVARTRKAIALFEERFWSGGDLALLYKQLPQTDVGLAPIFRAGFQEFSRLRQQRSISPDALLEGVQRAMRIAATQSMDVLERHLGVLATVGSVSPYVGLFGTVWGIMTSFRALGSVSQATISMVAPGISEALIATAIGLLAAIPAVVGYNRFSGMLERIDVQFETFREEFTNILQRQLYH